VLVLVVLVAAIVMEQEEAETLHQLAHHREIMAETVVVPQGILEAAGAEQVLLVIIFQELVQERVVLEVLLQYLDHLLLMLAAEAEVVAAALKELAVLEAGELAQEIQPQGTV
jgi:hypothetical protein